MFGQILNLFDPFRFFKYQLAQTCYGQNVNNAWFKLWELVWEFGLVPGSLAGESFVSFHNAGLPGHWILALNHYVKTATNLKSHVWFGLAPSEAEDTFKLRERYPGHWLPAEPGDVDELSYVRAARDRFTERVHLYTSDQGLDAAEYEGQEAKHARLNVGQILLGLYTLRPGGHMVVRLYTFFEPLTQSVIAFCAGLFREVHIAKPLASKIINSECYLVALDLTPGPHDLSPLERWLDLPVANLGALEGVTGTVDLTGAGSDMAGAQAASLTIAMSLYDRVRTEGAEGAEGADEKSNGGPPNHATASDEVPGLRELRNMVRLQHNQITTSWSQRYPVRTLRLKDRLNCLEGTARPNMGGPRLGSA
jgi:hypothetical protein